MYCSNCGNKCRDGATFCSKCGAALFTTADGSESGNNVFSDLEKLKPGYGTDSGSTEAEPEGTADPGIGSEPSKKRRGMLTVAVVVILAAVAAIAALFFLKGGGSERQYEKHMEAGRVYLEEESYEEAVAEFEEAIAIDDMVVEPYQLMAQAYNGLEDDEKVDKTYDTVRRLVVTVYEQSDGQELLDDAKETYIEAITYYGEQGDTATVEEVSEEIIEMLPDEEEIQEVTDAANLYLDEDEGLAEADEQSTDAETSESDQSWNQLYADYLETADANDGYYFLIQLNDDDVPEILFNGSSENAGCVLYYIQDGQVREENMMYENPIYVEHGGYIFSYGNRSGESHRYYHEQMLYLNENNELITVFEGSYTSESWAADINLNEQEQYTDVMANNESVSVSEYLELHDAAHSEFNECEWVYVEDGLLYSYGYRESTEIGTSVTESASAMIVCLRSL